MGEIVFWTIIRIILLIPSLWILEDYIQYRYWFTFSLFAIYGIVIHPTIIHYRLFIERNKEIIEATLCSSCKHFDESAVLCMKYDEHPTLDFLPCDGVSWEPVGVEHESKDADIDG